MNNKLLKVILMIFVTLTVFIASTSTVFAKDLSSVQELTSDKNIGNRISHKKFNMSDYEIYCIQHNKATNRSSYPGMYKVCYYLELNPDNVKLWGEDIQNKEQNIDENSLVLTYILAADENGSPKRGWYNNTQPPRQIAFWMYMPTWMKNVGHNLGISSKWDFPFTWKIDKDRREKAEAIIKHGEEYAKNPKVEISNAGTTQVEEVNNTTIGPVKLKFTHSISEITVTDVDGNAIDKNNITFSSDAEGKNEIKLSDIKSLDNFYIQNKSGKSAGNLSIKSTGKVYSAKVWFITHVSAAYSTIEGGKGQSHVIVDSSEEEKTTEINIKVKEKLADLKILKQDENTKNVLTDAKFKIYAKDKGFVTEADGKYVYNGTESTAKEVNAGEQLKGLEYGVYYIYETKAPDGYDMTKQDGYMNNNGKDPYSYSKDNKWVYLGEINLTENKEYTFTVSNRKIVSLEGYVWLDKPDTKANVENNIYDNGESLLEGITVNIYNGSGNKVGTTKTDSTGHYKFENLIYSGLTNAYIEFEYDNTKYIVVDPLVGNNNSINSKAIEKEMLVDELEDEKLTGLTGNLPGRAITKLNAGNLQQYYDASTYKVKDINLGLKEKSIFSHAVDETLEYVKVKMKGYTYTYKYGEDPKTISTYVPTVNEQNSKATFTAKIYPSDIAYNAANATDELKVYVVYKIGVTNTNTTNIDDIAVEQKLYLTSLTNTFDTARYELSTESNGNNDNENNQFKLWSVQGNKATYNVNDNNSAYKDGMAKNETKTSYIQFRIKEDALEKILTKTLTEGDIENAPTVAETLGFHEYLRTDNVWDNNDVVKYNGAKQPNYPANNTSGEKYYVHKSINAKAKSSDLYIRLSLGEQRTISGTVFEDIVTEESKKANQNLGNGILEAGEKNRASKVTVELLDSDKKTVSKLYQVENKAVVYQNGNLPDAKTETAVGGTYEFKGVVPGYYYIRFTYGDGSQVMMPASDAIKSNDYKSTIINTKNNNNIIKNAMEATAEQISNAQQVLVNNPANEDAKKLVEWYKYLGDTKYSTAVDDLEQRKATNGYTYKEDGTVYDNTGKLITNYKPTNVNSYTPIIGISIENDTNDSKEVKEDAGDANNSCYDAFNFGIITVPNSVIKVDKIMTNVTLTNQAGATVVNANPKESDHLLTALDKVDGGSKYAKMELEEGNIYGSDLAVTYKITITNKSDKDYVEKDGTNEYGNYYKYGDSTYAQEKVVSVQEVTDILDEKYNLDSIPKDNLVEIVIRQDKKEERKNNSIKVEKQDSTSSTSTNTTTNPDGTTTTKTTKSFTMSGWSSLKTDESSSTEYTVTSLLSNKDDDTEYLNAAKITSVKLDKLTTLTSGYDWTKIGLDDAVLVITPPTGSDRSDVYLVATAVAFGTIVAGIIVLKKKVL